MQRRKAENRLYPVVEKYIKNRFGCIATAINRGTKYGRIDVIGIRDTSGDLSSAHELIGVEVKAGNQPFGNAAGQAFGYSIYSHRCYLADKRKGNNPYTTEEIDIASSLGIGLLAVSGSKINEILAAPLCNPIEKFQLEIINKLGYGKCTLCNALFNIIKMVSKSSLINAAKKEKGSKYFLLNSPRFISDTRSTGSPSRYLCADCVMNLTNK